jgi:hypothetical protein
MGRVFEMGPYRFKQFGLLGLVPENAYGSGKVSQGAIIYNGALRPKILEPQGYWSLSVRGEGMKPRCVSGIEDCGLEED